jgi:hypothetical protein
LPYPTGRTFTPKDQEIAALDRAQPRLDAMAAATPTAQSGGYGDALLSPSEQAAEEQNLGRLGDIGAATGVTAEQIVKDYGEENYNKVSAIMVERDKALGRLNDEAAAYDRQLFDIRMQLKGQQQSMDQALTQWAKQMPTHQATYAASMHIAPILSIMAAIGGAATKTNAIGLLQATTGIVQGVNSGNEVRYQDAMEEWKNRYQALQDHLTRVNDTYKTFQDAYAGMADADDRAAARTRLVMNDRLETAQLKIARDTALLAAQEKAGSTLGNIAKVFPAIEAARARARYGYGGIFGGWQGTGQSTPAQPGQNPLDRKLSEVSPAEVVAEITAQMGGQVPGGVRGWPIVMRGFMSDHPDWSIREGAEYWRSMKLGMTTSQSMLRAMATRTAATLQAQFNLTKPDGIYNELRMAADKVNLGDTILQQQAQIGTSKWITTNPDIRRYVTALEEARAELSIVLARSGRQSDITRTWAEEALPLVTSRAGLEAAIDESTRIGQSVAVGDAQMIEFMQANVTAKDLANYITTGRAPGGSAAAGATTQQQQTAPGARPQTDAQGRVLRQSRSQGPVYVNPNDPSDWVKAQ